MHLPSSGKFFSVLESTRLSGAFLTSIFVSQETESHSISNQMPGGSNLCID